MKRIYKKLKIKICKKLEYKDRKILKAEDGNNIIKDLLNSNDPFLVSRIGGTELEVLGYYLYKDRCYDNYIKEKISLLSGVFPTDNECLNKFCEEYIYSIKNSDCIGVWFNKNEGKVINKFNKLCILTELRALEPYYWNEPWSKYLEGKKVLVIHPFKNSIINQYKKREYIFENKDVLPKFDLKVLKAVQSLAGNEVEYNNWHEALQSMKDSIKEIDFDIAIIGAGAYGLPLGSYIKSIGKQAIHLGGAIQILFGIKGKRWDNHPVISKLYNEYWTRPTDDEIYNGAKKVEGGCYW